MKTPGDPQLEIPFGRDPSERGYTDWLQQRRDGLKRLARELGLPLDHRVEVCLRSGIVLRGILHLRDVLLFFPGKPDPGLSLIVDGVSFSAEEIESCIRTD